MKCISSVMFSLQVSRRKISSSKPGRVVRQGDPLLPCLIIMAVDVLLLMIQYHVDRGELAGIKLSQSGPVLSHCFFADDVVFFVQAEKNNCLVLKKILEVFCGASGQQMNLDKSCVFFSANAKPELQEEISNAVGISASANPGKYLELPVYWKRSKVAALNFVTSKIGMRLQGWKQKLLTYAGEWAER